MSLSFTPARELAALVRARRVSAREVMAQHLERIRRLNPSINAIVAKLDDEQCLALADEADRRLDRGEAVGPLHGLPFAFKDLEDAVGFPTSRGSPIFRDFHPSADSVIVARLRRAGVIGIGKTNVPEFGMGSHTYNRVYGTTRNPYDVSKSAGGSSGGAGAALAAGLVPLADGSDLGGSLRNPANFNNVVALRPSVGLVASEPESTGLPELLVRGPMARSVDDCALLLAVMSGGQPIALGRDPRGVRVAWSPDLGGLPLDPRVRAVLDRARAMLESIGCILENRCPDLSGADEAFLTIRARRSWLAYAALLDRHRDELKPEAVREIEAGEHVTGDEVERAARTLRALRARMDAFFARVDILACAVNQVPPFDASIDWPHEIDGHQMDHYVAWMKSAYWITATTSPAASVPVGFTDDGLRIGLQLVRRVGDDAGVLQLAHAIEQAAGVATRRPALGAEA